MDGKGRYTDNIFVERVWRTVKYEDVYLKTYSNGREARVGLEAYFHFYNNQRPHQTLGHRPRCSTEIGAIDRTPDRGEVVTKQSIGKPWKDGGAFT